MRRFYLFSRCAMQQQLVTNVGADDVIDQRAHVPLRTRRRSPPVVRSDESQPPCELVIRHHEQLDPVSRRGHMHSVARRHLADQDAHLVSFGVLPRAMTGGASSNTHRAFGRLTST
jgi:hypothetical protein